MICYLINRPPTPQWITPNIYTSAMNISSVCYHVTLQGTDELPILEYLSPGRKLLDQLSTEQWRLRVATDHRGSGGRHGPKDIGVCSGGHGPDQVGGGKCPKDVGGGGSGQTPEEIGRCSGGDSPDQVGGRYRPEDVGGSGGRYRREDIGASSGHSSEDVGGIADGDCPQNVGGVVDGDCPQNV